MRALLMGDGGRLPFAGHLRLHAGDAIIGLEVAARLGPRPRKEEDIVAAWWAACALREALQKALAGVFRDRHEPLWRLWEAIAALPDDALGPARGADLCLLAASFDGAGQAIAGVGLAGVQALGRAGPRELVGQGHPLLTPPGRPARLPGVLKLGPDEVAGVIGRPWDVQPPPPGELLRRAGAPG